MNTIAKQILAVKNHSEQSMALFRLAVKVTKDFNDQDMTFFFSDGSVIRHEDGEMIAVEKKF